MKLKKYLLLLAIVVNSSLMAQGSYWSTFTSNVTNYFNRASLWVANNKKTTALAVGGVACYLGYKYYCQSQDSASPEPVVQEEQQQSTTSDEQLKDMEQRLGLKEKEESTQPAVQETQIEEKKSDEPIAVEQLSDEEKALRDDRKRRLEAALFGPKETKTADDKGKEEAVDENELLEQAANEALMLSMSPLKVIIPTQQQQVSGSSISKEEAALLEEVVSETLGTGQKNVVRFGDKFKDIKQDLEIIFTKKLKEQQKQVSPQSEKEELVQTEEQLEAQRIIEEASAKISNLDNQFNSDQSATINIDDIAILQNDLNRAIKLDANRADEIAVLNQKVAHLRSEFKGSIIKMLQTRYSNAFCKKGSYELSYFDRMAEGILNGDTFDAITLRFYDNYLKEKDKFDVYWKNAHYRCNFATLLPMSESKELRSKIFTLFQKNADVDVILEYTKSWELNDFKTVADESMEYWLIESRKVSKYSADVRKKFKDAHETMRKALSARQRAAQPAPQSKKKK